MRRYIYSGEFSQMLSEREGRYVAQNCRGVVGGIANLVDTKQTLVKPRVAFPCLIEQRAT